MDIEEVVGAGCWDTIRRVFAGISCLWCGSATGYLAIVVADAIYYLARGLITFSELGEFFSELGLSLVLGPFLLLGSGWLLLMAPLVLIVYWQFVREDTGTLRQWVGLSATTGLLVVLGYLNWDVGILWSALPFALLLGFAGALGALAFFLSIWQRRRLEQHLLGVAVENEERRREMLDEFGTAVADREFATGEGEGPGVQPPPPVVPPKPNVPRPRNGDE